MRYRDLFRDHEFSGMWVADVLSMVGSYLAKIAVAALVYDRTNSPGLTAAAFAISFAPYLFAPVLATIADRFPRKQLLVLTDVLRCLLVLLLVIPGMPLPLLLVILFGIEIFQIPFGAARLATLADILDEDRFPVGNALVAGTRQALQVGGFLLGGVIVALTGPPSALALNAVSYLASAVLILIFVRRRPQPWAAEGERPAVWASTLEGLRIVAQTPGMRGWFALLALGPGIVVVSEGLAVPWADQLGGGTMLAGIIMATAPLGNVFGFAYFGRQPLERQRQLIYPCAVGCGLLVALSGLSDYLTGSPVPVVILLTLAGGSLGYLTAIQSLVAKSIPSSARGRVFGLGNAVIQIGQGIAVLVAGAMAEAALIGLVLGILGVVAVLLVGAVAATARSMRAVGPQ